MMMDLAAFVVAGGASFALTPVVIAEAKRAGALDYPGAQKVHAEPVPTLGGLGLAAAVLGTLWILELMGIGIARAQAVGLTLAAVPVVAVGVWDDLRAVSIPVKLGVHFLAGGILYAAGLRVVELTNPFGATIQLGPLGLAITVLWVATVINALNLVDGLDGLAPGIGGIAALSLCAVGFLKDERDVAVLALILAGAVAGFYPYNFPRARVFLGDVGSTFIGLVLATIALLENRKATAAMTLLLPLVALGLPVLDTLFAVVRRTARGKNPLRRDLGHLHHRLLRLGLTPRGAVGWLLGASAVFGLVAVWLSQIPKQAALSVTVGLGLAIFVALGALRHLERRANGQPG
ncbi:MAG TPA: MraY family glycosyltransferase [Methylomirabilota bacterium]|jgi:UDP-GlcNAc:undecaprenyl-phosphate GlcNAc-1-phosphate transferase|nr:MraY family glycosyltransferase [Methylomirabilota bacterium]